MLEALMSLAAPSTRRAVREPTAALHVRALANLQFIRETMENAGSFTAVPGWGGVLMGVSALAATAWASRAASREEWLFTWLVEAVVAVLIGVVTLARKARAAGVSLLTGPGRRFVMSLSAPLAVGAFSTYALASGGLWDGLPGVWLLNYGAAVTAGGAVAVRVVPILGLSFMLVGAAALVAPPAWGNFFMAVGFGGLNVVFGLIIARKHGG